MQQPFEQLSSENKQTKKSHIDQKDLNFINEFIYNQNNEFIWTNNTPEKKTKNQLFCVTNFYFYSW